MLFISPEKNREQTINKFILKYWASSPDKVIGEVKRYTVTARENGATVKWLTVVPEYLMIISDPEEAKGWIRLEEFDLSKDHNDRQQFIIYKENQPYVFQSILKLYDYLWFEKGIEPSD